MMFSFPTRHLQCWVTTGCPKKSYIQKLLDPECTRSITSSRHPSQPDLDEPVSGNYFFGRFLLRLSRIKRFQVMPRGKFGSAGCSTQFRLGFLGFSSILKVAFFLTPCMIVTLCSLQTIVHHNCTATTQ